MEESENTDSGSHVSRPVIIIERNSSALGKLSRSLKEAGIGSGKILRFKDTETALKSIKDLIRSGVDVDLVISDLYFNDEINIYGLIRAMEEIPKLWNTPLAIFTNEATMENVYNIRKEIRRLPFRFVLKGSNEAKIAQILKDMGAYKFSNQKFLDLELKTDSFIKYYDTAMLPMALRMLNEYGLKYPKVCTPVRVELLKGKLYNAFSFKQKLLLDPIQKDMRSFSPGDKLHDDLVKDMNDLSEEAEDLRSKAKRSLMAAYKMDPNNWRVLQDLYQFYMDEKDLARAKRYLSFLIQIFPKKWDLFIKMGKIHELERNFLDASKNYFDAARNALEEGLSNISLQDIVDIANRSLEMTQKMLVKMGASEIKDIAEVGDSPKFATMRALRKSNAQVRSILIYASKKSPGNADYLNKIGITYRRAGDYPEAIREYQNALAIEPGNPIIRMNLIVAMALAESWGKALEELKILQTMDIASGEEDIVKKLQQILTQRNKDEIRRILRHF